MPADSAGETRTTTSRPAYAYVLRALREARGVTQDGWAAILNYSVATVRRWESGLAVPPAEAEAALLHQCQQHGLFRTYDVGPLRGLSLTPELLRSMLAEARLAGGARSVSEPASRITGEPAVAPLPTPSGGPIAAHLPLVLSSFVGRAGEINSVRHLVSSTRLVTLTGPGGVGKTRLALEVAHLLVADFADDVCWVDLAPVVDPELLQSTVAQALGLRGADVPLAALRGALQDRRLVLVLDNFEQVLAAAPRLLELLAACPGVHALVTSRAALRLRGEQVFPVPPLSLPDDPAALDADALAQSEAISLFVKRAQEVRPTFALDPANAATIADICQRLDGLPLALELAAARLQMLTPESLLGRLDQHLTLLVGGALDLPARQQTLRATLDWSYELLHEPDRQLLRGLAVFAGGCGLEAIEFVLGAEPLAVVERLGRLVSHSLVVLEDVADQPRYRLLETVRQYSLEKLEASGDGDATRTAHLDWCLRLVEEAEPLLGGPQQGAWMARLDREQDNVRAALRWGLDRGLHARVLRLGAAFWRFWWTRAYFPEGQRWLEELLLVLNDAVDLDVRARLLEGAGWMADVLGDLPRAEQHFEAALALRRAAGDKTAVANTLGWLSFVVAASGDLTRAISLAQDGVLVARELGEVRTIAQALTRLGTHLTMDGDAESGAPLLEEGAELARRSGDLFTAAAALDSLGAAERQRGNLSRAIAVLTEDMQLVDEIGYGITAAEVRYHLADTLARTGDIDRARSLCVESLRMAHAVGDARRIGNALRVAAAIEIAVREHAKAVTLCSAAESVLASKGIRWMPVERSALEACLETASQELAPEAFELSKALGRSMDVDQAVRWAL
jgi:predicted ATPase/DNA-binding transcriptional regulator YiaG